MFSCNDVELLTGIKGVHQHSLTSNDSFWKHAQFSCNYWKLQMQQENGRALKQPLYLQILCENGVRFCTVFWDCRGCGRAPSRMKVSCCLNLSFFFLKEWICKELVLFCSGQGTCHQIQVRNFANFRHAEPPNSAITVEMKWRSELEATTKMWCGEKNKSFKVKM